MISEDLYGLLINDYFHDIQSIINFSLTTKFYVKCYAKNISEIEKKYLDFRLINPTNLHEMVKSIINKNSEYLSKCFRMNKILFRFDNVKELSIIAVYNEKGLILSSSAIYIKIHDHNHTVMYFYQEKAFKPLHVININKFNDINFIFNGNQQISSYKDCDLQDDPYEIKSLFFRHGRI